MALVIADRVRETTTTTGTGNIALGGAVVGYQSFALGIGASNTTYYVIADQNGANWETGLGTLDATGTALARTTVLSSSNSNTLVNFPAGTKDVFCSLLSSKAVYKDGAGAPVGAGTVTSASVASANGFAGTVATPGTTPAITMTVTFSGLAKGNGTGLSAAVAGTDYLAPPSGTALLKANSGGALANATAGADYLAPPSGSAILKANAGGALANAVAGTDYAPATSGSAILKGNAAGGFASAVAKTDYAPATSGSAILKGDGLGGFSSAASGTDYAPATSGTAILKGSGTGGFSAAAAGTDYQAAITATGLLKGAGSGSVSAATAGTDYLAPPSGTSILKANSGGALANAVAGTDYVAPGGALGTPSSGNLSNCTADGTNAVGFLNIPQNSQSAAYTLVAGDAGKHLLHPAADTTARTFTIPANASVAYPIGTAITFVNQNGAGTLSIAITTDAMRLAGAGTTGTRTLAANGVATAIKITSTEWIISGMGLT